MNKRGDLNSKNIGIYILILIISISVITSSISITQTDTPKTELIQHPAKLGEPVKWTKKVYTNDTNYEIQIPENAKKINKSKEFITSSSNDAPIFSNSGCAERRGCLEIQYETLAPKSKEKILKNSKEILIYSDKHYVNVTATTSIPFNITQKENMKLFWKEENIFLDFQAHDKNNDSFLDEIEWVVPHLSNQTFEIILISNAEHLDENKNLVENIYNQTKERDDIWSPEIKQNEYVRVKFEIPLDNRKDITIYARSNNDAKIEVYSNETKVAEFETISEDKKYKILLTELQGLQDTFDLKIINGSVEFDFITDPQETLYVNNFDSTYTAWTTSGTSPWIDNDTSSYIRGKADNIFQGNFDFQNSSIADGDINSVTLYFETSAADAPNNDGFEIFLSDGATFTSMGIIQPTSTSYTWESVSVMSKLDTWDKIDAAQMYLVIRKSGGADNVDIRRSYLYVDYEDPDLTPPIVTLIQPTSYQNFSSTSVNFNCSATDSGDGLKNSTLYGTWGSGWHANETISITGSSNSSFFSKTISDGTYLWNCYVCDIHAKASNCDFASSNQTFTVDTTPPYVEITSPQNETNWSDNTLDIEYIHSDSGVGIETCWYSNDTYSTNTTLSICNNITSVTWTEGSHNLTIWTNDTLGNKNSTTITFYIDSTPPTAILTSPTQDEIINTSTYSLNASLSTDSGIGLANATWYYKNATSYEIIGSDIDPSDGLNYTWTIDVTDGVYNISVNVTDLLGLINEAIATNITIDKTNDNPSCVVGFPNGAEELNGQLVINATASDPDPSDYVKNLTFYYSTNNGTSWNLIGTNITQALSLYTYSWDTSLDTDGIEYSINCTAQDSRGGINSDLSDNNFTIDNTAPTISAEQVNSTDLLINEYICLNATITDNIVGVQSVLAEVDLPEAGDANITLLDDGLGCDDSSGDNIYSAEYKSSLEGTYNWTKVYAADIIGNIQITYPGLNWTTTSDANLITIMLNPTSNIEINESAPGNDFNINCNATCNQSGSACDDVEIFIEYTGSWTTVTTSTTDIINSVDNYSCGNLASGQSCNYTFTITSEINKGGNDYPFRCYASSSNAAADFSIDYDLHINNDPVADFTYPSNNTWIHGIENLNASDSIDTDGLITNYHFELDNNSAFSSPITLCDSGSINCSFNTSSQSECTEESPECYIRLTVIDNSSVSNSTFIQIGIDNIAPSSNITLPDSDSLIFTESQVINVTPEDFGSGIDCVEFEFFNGTWNTLGTTCGSPYIWNWDLSPVPDQEDLEVRARTNDSEGNWGTYDTHDNITHDTTKPIILLNSPANQTPFNQTTVTFNFTATDNIKQVLNCSLYIDTTQNQTNNSVQNNTQTIFTISGINEGLHSWFINCSDSGLRNTSEIRNFTIDLTPPTSQNQNQTISGKYQTIFHRGDSINLSAEWSDNFNLSFAWLSTNESGTWQNKTVYSSPQSISNITDISSFNWTNNSMQVGDSVYWKIYANDSAGNENVTGEMFFTLWGWAGVSGAYLSPAGIKEGETTTMNCITRDNVTHENLQNYNVSFYNETGYMGSNLTGSDGIAKWTFSVDAAGTYPITCNITDNSAIFYNFSNINQGQATLGVGYGMSVYDYNNLTYHGAYEGIDVNDTSIFTEINDPYSDIEDDNNVYQEYISTPGDYAFTRFEFKIEEELNEITQFNITWTGYGDVGSGTQGYILYIYNITGSSWKEEVIYSTDSSKQTSYIGYTTDISDFINSSGYMKILARSYDVAPDSGPGVDQWAMIATDYVKVEVQYDIIAPTVILSSPINYYNSSSSEVTLKCNISDDQNIENTTLYGNWTGWHPNETNSSGLNNVNYTFIKNITDGTYLWNCYACDHAGNCEFAEENNTITIDTVPPAINLTYPINFQNFSIFTISQFNFSVSDATSDIINCSLYGNWSAGWHDNQTITNPQESAELNFSSVQVEGDDFYIWNVKCTDYAGNSGMNSTNFTFSAFLPSTTPLIYNITQTSNDGLGNITVSWNASNHTTGYEIHAGATIPTISYLTETTGLNYTDITFAGNKRRFYRIVAKNPISQNNSEIYSAHLYELKHNTNDSANWIAFPSNFTYLRTANETVNEIPNATGFTLFNETTQIKVTCNNYSCPDILSCTPTNCNFNIQSGRGYEVNLNTSESSEVNWSGVGKVYSLQIINLTKNATSFGKNWITLYANTTLTNAQGLIGDISNADAITKWNSTSQKSIGLIPSPFPWIPGFIGTNFQLNLEDGYEVSVTSSGQWTQS